MPKERGLEIAAAFYSATRGGGMDQLRSLLAGDVVFYSDGGGKRPAAKRPLFGIDDVMQFHSGLARLFGQRTAQSVQYCFINGLPGFVTIERDGAQTTAFDIENDKIAAIYIVRNPDKLRRLGDRSVH
jgi:RNA polymerase sigma-70 factor (ECF subfamily)